MLRVGIRRYSSPSLLHLRVGKILKCEVHENAEKLYVSQIEVDAEPLQVCSGLVGYIPREQLVDRKVVVLTNLKPSKMRGVQSQAMLLATEKDNRVELINPPASAAIGSRLQFDSHTSTDIPPRLKSKIWQEIQQHLKTNAAGEAVFEAEEAECKLRDTDGNVAFASTLTDSIIR